MPALLGPTAPHPSQFGGSFRALHPARMKMGTLVAIGVFASGVEIASAGQLPQGSRDARHAPATLQQKPGSPLVTKEERKPYDLLFQTSAVRLRLEQEKAKKGPVLLDSVPTPTRRSGPCGLVFLDERRDIDPRMIVPVPPGEFAIRKAIPDTCRKD
jgi:hypothetical protein